MTLTTMYDSIEASVLPANAQAYAGYVGGHWPDFSLIAQRFPHAHLASIAVNAEETAEWLDCESGDATPAQCPGWFKVNRPKGARGIYAPFFLMEVVVDNMRAAGLKDDEWEGWVADWNNVHDLMVVKGKVMAGHQYIDHGPSGQNWDESTVSLETFFAVAVVAKPSPVQILNTEAHYDWFDDKPRSVLGKRRIERNAVKLYDKLRAQQTPTKHPHRVQLNFVRKVLKYYAGRVYKVAHDEPVKSGPRKGRPSWGSFHRGWRYQQLHHRAQGQEMLPRKDVKAAA